KLIRVKTSPLTPFNTESCNSRDSLSVSTLDSLACWVTPFRVNHPPIRVPTRAVREEDNHPGMLFKRLIN
ncbi:hypothetical protein, partial [Escherichia coli]|uniref:hypothetical protein n=1 Tax=Escherichia coli TaxID=562 RepID=UPI001BAEBFF8